MSQQYSDDEAVELLYLHYNLGISASIIGQWFGTSKRSVLGFTFRIRKQIELHECKCVKPENKDGGMPEKWWVRDKSSKITINEWDQRRQTHER